jgi:hypothetical protein
MSEPAVVRLTSNGHADITFDTNGVAEAPLEHVAMPTYISMTVRSNGHVVVTGSATDYDSGPPFNDYVAVTQVDATGALDTGFDGDGQLSYTYAGHSLNVEGIAPATGTDVLLVGHEDDNTSTGHAWTWVLDDAGSNTQPQNFIDVSPNHTSNFYNAFDAVTVSGGSAFVGGHWGYQQGELVGKLDATTGQLDTTFDGDGLVQVASGQFMSQVGTDSQGRIVTKETYVATAVLRRFSAAGVPDSTLVMSNVVPLNVSDGNDDAFAAMAIEADDDIVLAGGSQAQGDTYHRSLLTTVVGDDSTAPTGSATETEGTAPGKQYNSASDVWVDPTAHGNFSVIVAAADNRSGVKQVSFPTSIGAGWTGGGVDTSAPYTATYEWDGTGTPVGEPGQVDFDVTDGVGNVGQGHFTVTNDTTAPSGTLTLAPGPNNDGTPHIVPSPTDGVGGSGIADYKVRRAPSTYTNGTCVANGDYADVPGSSAGAFDDTLPAGPACYAYLIYAHDNVGHLNEFDGGSSQLKYDPVAPTAALTLTPAAGAAGADAFHLRAGTHYFNPTHPGSFTVSAAASDANSGIATPTPVTFPTLGTGWTSGSSTSTTQQYSWDGTAVGGTFTVIPHDQAGNDGSASMVLAADSTAPTGAAVSHAQGATTNATVSLTVTAGSDAGAGIASTSLQRAMGTDATCTSVGGYTQVSTSTGAVSDTLPGAGCYTYRLVVTDFVGNVEMVDASGNVQYTLPAPPPPDTTAPTVTVDTQPAASSTTTSGSVAWHADETATFRCSLDAAPLAACTSPVALTGLSVATHAFVIEARDASGNVSTKTVSFEVTAPPATGGGDPAPTPTPTPDPAVTAPVTISNGTGAVTAAASGSTFTVVTGQTASCPAGSGSPACTATLVATVPGTAKRLHGKAKVVQVGKVVVTIAPGKAAKLTFKLTPAGAKLLRAKGSLNVQLTLTLKHGATVTTKSRALKVKLPRKKH